MHIFPCFSWLCSTKKFIAAQLGNNTKKAHFHGEAFLRTTYIELLKQIKAPSSHITQNAVTGKKELWQKSFP